MEVEAVAHGVSSADAGDAGCQAAACDRVGASSVQNHGHVRAPIAHTHARCSARRTHMPHLDDTMHNSHFQAWRRVTAARVSERERAVVAIQLKRERQKWQRAEAFFASRATSRAFCAWVSWTKRAAEEVCWCTP